MVVLKGKRQSLLSPRREGKMYSVSIRQKFHHFLSSQMLVWTVRGGGGWIAVGLWEPHWLLLSKSWRRYLLPPVAASFRISTYFCLRFGSLSAILGQWKNSCSESHSIGLQGRVLNLFKDLIRFTPTCYLHVNYKCFPTNIKACPLDLEWNLSFGNVCLTFSFEKDSTVTLGKECQHW